MTKIAVSLTVLYVLFATFSTAINLGAQMLSIWAYAGAYAVEVSILTGTVMALPLRYLLEKRYIFAFKSHDIVHDGQLFVLYSLMGLFTTVIFWGMEYAFYLIYDTSTMRYAGGVLGLAIGFYVKYQLDRKFVFVSSSTKVLI